MRIQHKTLTCMTLALALVAGLVTALPASAAQAPMAEMFVPGSTTLTPAGERWLDQQMAQQAARKTATSQMLIVKLPGTQTSLQQRRAQVLREKLVTLGAPTERVFFEAGGR